MTESTPTKTNWPVFRSLASFRPSDLPGDLIAGLTLAAIAIPEQMATARLGGFSPQIGFFAFIAGSLGFAMLGGNRFLSCGADSTITPIFAGGLALLATSGSSDYQALAIALALMVGVILVLGSLFRLGWIANLLSTPVTVGFLAGISVHIMVSQMPGVLGLPPPKGPTLDKIAALAQHLGESNLYTLCIGFGVLAVVAYTTTSLAKLYSEAIEGIERGPVDAITATGATRLQVLRYGVLPQVLPLFLSYVLYRLETNIRAATVLGFVGAGGIGFYLQTYLRMIDYPAASTVLLVTVVMVMVVDAVSSRLRARLV